MSTPTSPVAIDYGPLHGLVGRWEGDKGLDVSPEPDGAEESPYRETIEFVAAGDVANAGSQTLAIVRYHQVVRRRSNGEIFHDQVGYWLWDAATGTAAHSIAIPRAVCVLAGGRVPVTAPGAPVVIAVRAALGDPDWGIVQSPFMRDHARTDAFRIELTIDGDRLAYAETTSLSIYGRTFEHTDRNELRRVA